MEKQARRNNWSPTSLLSSARGHLNTIATSWSLENVSSGDSNDTPLYVLGMPQHSKLALKRSTQSLASAGRNRFVPRDISKLNVGHTSSSLSAGDLLAQMEKMPAMKRMPKTKQQGSLDSMDFDADEEDEDYDDFGEELNFADSLHSSSSYLSSINSDTSFSNYRLSPLNFDDPRQAIASRLGYNCIESIELYHELHEALSTKVSDQTRRRACCKHVGRFGAGYEDDCHFPLVLPVFLNEQLKRNSAFATWEFIHLMADAELAHWEKSALDNLLNRFKTVPALGRPVDHVNPDPNLFLRQLVQQLRAGGFAQVARRAKNRALKRWSSYEDLHREEGGRSDMPAKSSAGHGSMTHEEALVIIMPQAKAQHHSPSCLEAPVPFVVNPKQLTGELLAYISRPGLFANKITKFQLQTFRVGLNMQLLSQLVLLKDIVGLAGGTDHHHQQHRLHNLRTLENLLAYDDVLVSVVRTHILRAMGPAQQAMAMRSVIEIAILLRQIGNYYGLVKVIGALQSPKVYLLCDAWRHLAVHMPYHFRDYQSLGRLARQLNHSILSTNLPHIPTLPGLLNRIKLCCSASWDLFEAKRRFCEHPSLADWLHTEIFGNNKCKFNLKPEPAPAGSLKIRFDPIRESFLSACDRIRLMDWTYFPTNWAQRYMPAMPEQHVRSLLERFETFFGPELDLYRRYQLPKISVAQYNHDQWL